MHIWKLQHALAVRKFRFVTVMSCQQNTTLAGEVSPRMDLLRAPKEKASTEN